MKFLVDTHLLLWAAKGFQFLPSEAQKLMSSTDNELFFSVVSLWEIVIKNGLRRENFQVEPRLFRRGLLDSGYIEMAIFSEHVVSVASLPVIHKDPFDRLLLAQAFSEGILLLTADNQLAKYSSCPVLFIQ